MIKYYTEKEIRNPEDYPGIDQSYIPLSRFKGIWKDENIVFSYSAFGAELMLFPDKGVTIISNSGDAYLPKEFLETNDVWVILDKPLSLYSTQFDPSEPSLWDRLIERYQNGETGELCEEEIKYRGEDYMKESVCFNTKKFPDLLDNLRYTMQFLYMKNPETPWEERKYEIEVNEDEYRILKEYAKKNIWDNAINNFQNLGVDYDSIKLRSFPFMGSGYLSEIEINPELEMFRLKRQNNEL